MENKSNFNKKLFAVSTLQKFLTDYIDGKNIKTTYDNFINDLNTAEARKPENLKINEEKRKIYENCRDLFTDTIKSTNNITTVNPLKQELDDEIATFRAEMKLTKDKKSTGFLIAQRILQRFSEKILGIDKRTYDMSQLATKGMLRTERTAQGDVKKVVAYESFEDFQKRHNKDDKKKPPEITLHDKYGNPIRIQFMGCLAYKTLSSNEYIYKHLITKTVNGVQKKHECFSNIDIFALKRDEELCDAVVSELLSENNLDRSNASGYIGEIYKQKTDYLELGDENFTPPFYTYKIAKSKENPSLSIVLVYDGEKIEAIKAHEQQQEIMKKSAERAISVAQSQAIEQVEPVTQPKATAHPNGDGR